MDNILKLTTSLQVVTLSWVISTLVWGRKVVELRTSMTSDQWRLGASSIAPGSQVSIDGREFTIQSEIGSGFANRVYEVTVEGEQLALKIPKDVHFEATDFELDRQGIDEQYFRHYHLDGEAKNLRRLRSKGIETVTIIEAHPNQGFLLMEKLDGPTWEELAKNLGRLDPQTRETVLNRMSEFWHSVKKI